MNKLSVAGCLCVILVAAQTRRVATASESARAIAIDHSDFAPDPRAMSLGGPPTGTICDEAEYELAQLPTEYSCVSDSLDPAAGHLDDEALSDPVWDGNDLAARRRAPSRTERGQFYGQVDALLWMQETRLNDQPIVVDANTGVTFLSTSDLDSNFAPGVQATVGKRLCNGKALEFSYLGLYPNGASATAISPDADAFLIFPGNFFGNVFVGMNGATANYATSLNGLTANLIEGDCECECGDECGCEEYGRPLAFEWIAGLRYINLRDELNISAQRVVNGEVEEGVYNIRTVNNLYGAQLGARVRRWPHPWGWEASGTAGVFANDASQEQYVTDFPNFPLRPTISRSDDTVAFVGEMNLTALYRLTNVWVLRAGYSVFWIDGVALAPNQLDFNFATAPSGDQLDTNGSIFFHGANVGLEANW